MTNSFPPAGGRGAVKAALDAFSEQGIPLKVVRSFLKANKPEGFDCPGCAFPDRPSAFGPDSCEQGQKAIAWEMTPKKADAAFFAQHTLTELRRWSNRDLEAAGRLTEPLRYDAAQDRYVPIGWDEAFALAGRCDARPGARARELLRQRPQQQRGRLSCGSCWPALMAAATCPTAATSATSPRAWRSKPRSAWARARRSWTDFEAADCILVVGQNPATNHPRLMGTLHAASKRGATVLALNPIVERGFVNFADPKDLGEMLTNTGRRVGQARGAREDRRRLGRAQGRGQAVVRSGSSKAAQSSTSISSTPTPKASTPWPPT